MRKLLAFLLTLAMVTGMLSGCAGVPVAIEGPLGNVKEEVAAVDGEAVKTGLYVSASLSAENATAEADGTTTTDISIIAVTVSDSGVIESCSIDAIQGKVSFDANGTVTSDLGEVLSKNELGENYGMKAFSPIGKEWNEQAAYIAEYAVGKTVEELKTKAIDEAGMVKDADLASGATIYMGSFIWGIEAAVNGAAHLGAVKGDQLVLTAISNNMGSVSADGETAGKTSVVSNIAAMTFHGDVITSAIFDCVQSNAEFGADGVVATEAGAVASKNQLGENYGLKAYSPIGKEWNEQVAAFADYITGKTAKDVAGIALTETTAPAEADLTSSVTIAVGDLMSLVEKAAAIAESMKVSVKTGYALTTNLTVESATAEADGTATTDVSLIAVTVTEEGVIESCAIDAIQGKVSFDAKGQLTSETGDVLSKNELGENYGMKAFSPIGKEWNEQAAYIAEYAVGKTVEELKTKAIDEAGMVKDADLASGATIYMGSFIWGIEAAVNNASYIGAAAGDDLVITSISKSTGSKSATAEEAGAAQVDANVIVMTRSGDRITSCIIDAVQSKAAFGADGAVTTESGAVASKAQLGEAYGLKAYSPIGKEWNEQAAAFCAYVTGKTAAEVAGIALTETTAPAEADLAASVSIAVGDFMALIEKAATVEAAAKASAKKAEVKTGYALTTTLSVENATAEADGTATTDISLIAVTVTEEGVIESCAIDAIQGKVSFDAKGQLTSETGDVLSKNELGENYGMKAFSPIGKEWNEQAAYIAEYAVGKTVEELKTKAIDEAGMVKDADLASGATIYMGSFIWGIEAAVNNASYLGATAGDELVITSIAKSTGSKAATAEEAGAAQVDANVAVVTKNGDVFTSMILDSVQSKAEFGADGVVTTEAGAVSSKNQLGENYGLKAYSPIGKEWNEQAAAFADYAAGKTAAEVAGIALTETTAPAETDLASSVTIAVGDFMALIEKLAK